GGPAAAADPAAGRPDAAARRVRGDAGAVRISDLGLRVWARADDQPRGVAGAGARGGGVAAVRGARLVATADRTGGAGDADGGGRRGRALFFHAQGARAVPVDEGGRRGTHATHHVARRVADF